MAERYKRWENDELPGTCLPWLVQEQIRRANALAAAAIDYKQYTELDPYSPDRFLSVDLALDAALAMYMGDDDE